MKTTGVFPLEFAFSTCLASRSLSGIGQAYRPIGNEWSRWHRSHVLDHERSASTGLAGALVLVLRPPLPAGDAGGQSPFDFPGRSGRADRVSPMLTPGPHPSGSGGPTHAT